MWFRDMATEPSWKRLKRITCEPGRAAARRKEAFLGWPAISIVLMMLATALYDPLSRLASISVAGVARPAHRYRVRVHPHRDAPVRPGRDALEACAAPLWPLLTLILLLAWPIVFGIAARP